MSNDKVVPASILVFGASRHIGDPLVRYLRLHAPQVRLRLATSRPEKVEALRAEHPGCEVVVANYYDITTLLPAFEGMQGIFIVTPDFLDERWAMTNVIAAARYAKSLVHLVRLVGDPPGLQDEQQVPKCLQDFDGGSAVQHLRARKILESSGLPVTYINIAAYFMNDFLTFLAPPVRARRTLVIPYDRVMAFLDTRDIGVAAAKLLLSPSTYHFGKTYNLDNGVDVMRFSEVAQLMSKVFEVPIAYDDSPESFVRECGDMMRAYMGRPDAPEYYLRYFEWERSNGTLARRTDILRSLLEIEPRTLTDWLFEHKKFLLGA